MFQKLKVWFFSIRFRNKAILVFTGVLFLIICMVSTLQIYMTNRLRFKDTQDNLSLITEQVGINFSQILKKQENSLYSAMKMFDLPLIIRASQNNGQMNNMRLALNQMLSTTSPYDFLMISTTNGTVLPVTSHLTSFDEIVSEAIVLLENSNGSNYGGCEWYHSKIGGTYLVRDIYDTFPLTYCGRIVAHIKDDYMFSLGAQIRELEYTFLFFTSNGKANDTELLFSVGPEGSNLIDEMMVLQQQGQLDQQKISIGNNSYFVSSTMHDSIKTIGITPLNRVKKSNRTITQSLVLYGGIGILSGILVLLFFMRSLMRQLDSLTNAMDSMASGNLDQTVPVISTDDIGQLATHFNHMSHKISQLLQRVVQEQTLKTKAQFKLLEYQYHSLQTQLNPHFIFNAMEAINAMAKVDGNTELSHSILQISHYFRLITNNINRQFITVGEELMSLRDYAQIHESIQGDRLQVIFACEEPVDAAVIPTMSLQPILENALVHGLRSASQVSIVHVSARLTEDQKVLITVQDNGCGITQEQREQLFSKKSCPTAINHTGVGLRNVMERLELLYGNDAQVKIESEPGNTCISVILPFSYEDPLEFDKIGQ